nr:MAG: hypothetical protein [Ips partiti-like virus 1]
MASKSEYTVPEGRSYSAWLSQYTQKLRQMSDIERSEERRENYSDDSQLYADYLDYVEEWQWYAEEKAADVLQRYIYIASNRHMKVRCGCGKDHVLTRSSQPEKGDTLVDDLSQNMYVQCWYKALTKKRDRVMIVLKKFSLRLPDPVEQQMLKIVQIQLANDGITPVLLPYDVFQSVWWGGEFEQGFAKRLLEVLGKHEAKQIAHIRKTLLPKVERKEVLLNFPDTDHGLHALLRELSEQDGNMIIKFINTQRMKLDPGARMINSETLLERQEQCTYCKAKQKAGISVPGVYYAPPGGGKTTAQNEELLVGFDTDWIGVGLNWSDYGMILTKRIPIITNQPEIFIGCGVKIVGIVPPKIRVGGDGLPLDNQQRLLTWAKTQSRNVTFIKVGKKEYFSDYVTELQMLAIANNMLANYTLNRLPFYKNEQTEEWTRLYPKLLRKKELEDTGQRRTLLE